MCWALYVMDFVYGVKIRQGNSIIVLSLVVSTQMANDLEVSLDMCRQENKLILARDSW